MNDRFESERIAEYDEILELIEKNIKYLESLGFETSTIHDFRRVLTHLRARSESEIVSILGRHQTRKTKRSPEELAISDETLRALTANEVRQYLKTGNNSRAFLERLASVRFGVTRGALTSLRSRQALIDKVSTLVSHEGTHDAISRAASLGSKTE